MVTLLAAQNIDGLQVTATGLSVVFLVLGMLWVVLQLLNVAFREPQAQPPQDQKLAEVDEPAPEPIPEPPAPIAPAIDPRLPAVITAAVVDTLDYVPGAISIRRAEGGRRPQVIAAILAAVASQLEIDDLPRSVRIQKVERR